MTVVIVLINSTNNDELEIVSISNINDGIVLEDLKQISNLNSNEQFVILNIWASWCIPCQNEVSELKILSETQGYSVIGILVEDSEENGKEFIKNNDISYQNILDNTLAESILIQFIWSGIPTTLVLDDNFEIISTINGEITANDIVDNHNDLRDNVYQVLVNFYITKICYLVCHTLFDLFVRSMCTLYNVYYAVCDIVSLQISPDYVSFLAQLIV